jgi:flagellar basal body-associated protein FliL
MKRQQVQVNNFVHWKGSSRSVAQRSGLGLWGTLLVCLLTAAITAGIIWVVFRKWHVGQVPSAPPDETEETARIPQEKAPGFMYPIKNLSVNLSDGFLNLTMEMWVKDLRGGAEQKAGEEGEEAQGIPAEVEEVLPMVRDRLIDLLSHRSRSQLASTASRDLLKEEIKKVVNDIFNENVGEDFFIVKEVFFSDFITSE